MPRTPQGYLEFFHVKGDTPLWMWRYVSSGGNPCPSSKPFALEICQRSARLERGQGTIPELYYT